MSQISNHTFDEIFIGQTATFSRKIGEQEILLYAAASGDVIRYTWTLSMLLARSSENA